MKHSALHKWRYVDNTARQGVNFMVYECGRCGARTLNGMPLVAPFNKECSRENIPICTGFGAGVRVFGSNLQGFRA